MYCEDGMHVRFRVDAGDKRFKYCTVCKKMFYRTDKELVLDLVAQKAGNT